MLVRTTTTAERRMRAALSTLARTRGTAERRMRAALALLARAGATAAERRTRSALALLACAALAAAGCGDAPPPAPTGSTLRATLVDRAGNGVLQRAPGEPLVDRTDLAPPARTTRVLATFAQLTDVHVRDEESPARVPFLDRLGKPFESTFRPQEALTAQVLAAAVKAVDAQHPDAVFETGDLIDNAQRNELDTALAVLRGGRVTPDSGARGYQGVQERSDPDPFYYRPDVDPPRHPGLLARAQRPFSSPGLTAPWYPVLGNHDILVAGEIAPTPVTEALATGDRMLVRLSPHVPVPRTLPGFARDAIDRLLAFGLPGKTRTVAADPRRAEPPAAETVARLRAAAHVPGSGPLLDYHVDLGPSVRAVVLDTIRRDLGSGPIVSGAQRAWLARELRAAGRRHVLVVSHQPLPDDVMATLGADRRVLAAIDGDTHHNRIQTRHGIWQVTTAALADFPQQARMFRVVETAGGGAALETWMVDTPPDPLADVARELAYLDAQGGRPAGAPGTRLDRNVRLYVRP
jgi:hypothetical protein